MIPLLVVQHAQQVQGLRVLLLARKHPLIQLGGLAQLTRPMHLDGGRQTRLACRLSVVCRAIVPYVPQLGISLRVSSRSAPVRATTDHGHG